jgi:tetratricopeptide (TPR) repeat protein
MKHIQQFKKILLLFFSAYLLIGCKKQDDFLNEKTNIALSIPTTITDFQDLLNNESIFNKNDPKLGALTGEDYFVVDASWISATTTERNAYIFAPDIFGANGDFSDWSNPYNAVYVANTVLEGLSKLTPQGQNTEAINQLKGQALFYRSWELYNLLQTFAMPYDSITASTDLGIPLRLTSDFNVTVGRSSVKNCYDQILNDLKNCLSLLPGTSDYKTRPTTVAANAALARIYLAMGKYNMALSYVNAALSTYNTLLDFNTLNASNYPISKTFVAEDIFHSILSSSTFTGYGKISNIDSNLLGSYDSNDLRKIVYFVKRTTGNNTFKASYDYKGYSYSGLATDELYLIRAECYARIANTTAAMNDLNTLLVKRWKTGTFKLLTASTADDALIKVLMERRKELIFRGLRWTDLRRLNKEDRFKQTLTRIINGVTYTLAPNSELYAMPIPVSEIQLNGIEQNKRY